MHTHGRTRTIASLSSMMLTVAVGWHVYDLTRRAFALGMVGLVQFQTMVQINTPDENRGRVSAVNSIFVGASNELGEFESGATAAWLGTVPAAVIRGIGTLVVVGSWTLLFPALRRVDRLER